MTYTQFFFTRDIVFGHLGLSLNLPMILHRHVPKCVPKIFMIFASLSLNPRGCDQDKLAVTPSETGIKCHCYKMNNVESLSVRELIIGRK